MMKHEFSVVFERGDGDWWIATALEIPGAFSQGKTIQEAREMLMDAIRELMLAEHCTSRGRQSYDVPPVK